jgi:hypothetical protein
VGSAPAVVTGAGSVVALQPAGVVVDATGPVRVDLRWSRWLAVSAGACLRPAPAPTGAGGGVAAGVGTEVEVVPSRPGRYVVSSSYLAPFTARHC